MRKLFFVISFSNLNSVPISLKWINADNEVRFKGVEIPELSGEKVSLEDIFFELEKNGLFIQSGFAQKRTSEKKTFFTMVKFEFSEKRKKPFEESLFKSSFLKIFHDAFWNIKIFSHEDNATVACSYRIPRFEGNDRLKPVTVWDKDSVTKERVGDKPRPIEADRVLSFSKTSLVLKEYK